jgi:hypothetical protein
MTHSTGHTRRWRAVLAAGALLLVFPFGSAAQENADCLMCHEDVGLTTERNGKTVSVYVDARKLSGSVHAELECVSCHLDLAGAEFPHESAVPRAQCGTCHAEEEEQHLASLHGQALERGDPLAPYCSDCHGAHDVRRAHDRQSPVYPMNIPFTCGKCHQEGSTVTRQRNIHQNNILENYSESIHGRGLLKGGLIVAATCASCHTAHLILPHTDPRSSIARRNIAKTCTQCHADIESVHEKVIRGELWEKESHVLPACVDCHQPHKIRRVFYSQGVSDQQCLSCHEKPDIVASTDGRSLKIDAAALAGSMHKTTACSQCHSGVNPSHRRPCDTITEKVDCANCHADQGRQFLGSLHGRLSSQHDPNAPNCKECHGTHSVLGKTDPASMTFATNIPSLCARCHREGSQAAVRYVGEQHEVVEHYVESIHGKGLLKSGLTVTATCTDCHTAHAVERAENPASSVNRANVPSTCGRCHHGIQDQFLKSIHATKVGHTDQPLPVCSDCHSAHTIQRADNEGFKLEIMQKCGRCHEAIASTYFDTYHGKVSQLGYTKTAKCYDCHGAHDILPVADPRSHLHRNHVVQTCQKCHPGANRQFAGYLTHATHHDPDKYPWLYYTFWGMTGLLVVTFVAGGLHTMLWLPRALSLRRQRKALLASGRAGSAPEGTHNGAHESDQEEPEGPSDD